LERRLREKLAVELTHEELWWLRDFNAKDGGGGPEFLAMCLPWVHAKAAELDVAGIAVGKLVAILQLAWQTAVKQLLFERRTGKNETPEECVGAFLKDYFA
jgi:hypothetical protein